MKQLEWDQSWSVGEDSLDSDHQALINIINRVMGDQEVSKPVDWVLQDLSEYVDYHFSREEGMLKSAGYKEIEAHINEHREFVEWLNTVKRTIETEPESRNYITESVVKYLKSWLKDHILQADMSYKGKL